MHAEFVVLNLTANLHALRKAISFCCTTFLALCSMAHQCTVFTRMRSAFSTGEREETAVDLRALNVARPPTPTDGELDSQSFFLGSLHDYSVYVGITRFTGPMGHKCG